MSEEFFFVFLVFFFNIFPLIHSFLGRWDSLSLYSSALDPNSEKARFYSSIIAIRLGDFPSALRFVTATRSSLDASLPALMSESIHRAYPGMVTAHQLAEMEEVVYYNRVTIAERAAAGGDSEDYERYRDMKTV